MKSLLDLPRTPANILFYWLIIPAIKSGIVMAIVPGLIG